MSFHTMNPSLVAKFVSGLVFSFTLMPIATVKCNAQAQVKAPSGGNEATTRSTTISEGVWVGIGSFVSARPGATIFRSPNPSRLAEKRFFGDPERISANEPPIEFLQIKDIENDHYWVECPTNKRDAGWIHSLDVIVLDAELVRAFSAIAREPKSGRQFLARSSLWSDRSEHRLAILDESRAIRLHAGNYAVYNNRGLSHSALGEYGEAVADFEAAINMNKQDFAVFINRAITFAALKKNSSAEADFDAALRLAPRCSAVHYNRGTFYYNIKNYQKAMLEFDRTIEFYTAADNNFLDNALLSRGVCHYEMKQYREAIEDYNRAIQTNVHNYKPYLNQAILWSAAPDSSILDGKRAIRAAQRACELTNNTYAPAIEALASSLACLGDFDQAIKVQERAVSLHTNLERIASAKAALDGYRKHERNVVK